LIDFKGDDFKGYDLKGHNFKANVFKCSIASNSLAILFELRCIQSGNQSIVLLAQWFFSANVTEILLNSCNRADKSSSYTAVF